MLGVKNKKDTYTRNQKGMHNEAREIGKLVIHRDTSKAKGTERGSRPPTWLTNLCELMEEQGTEGMVKRQILQTMK